MHEPLPYREPGGVPDAPCTYRTQTGGVPVTKRANRQAHESLLIQKDTCEKFRMRSNVPGISCRPLQAQSSLFYHRVNGPRWHGGFACQLHPVVRRFLRKREIMLIEREVPAAFVRSTNAVDSRSKDQSRASGHEQGGRSRVRCAARNHRSTCGLFS